MVYKEQQIQMIQTKEYILEGVKQPEVRFENVIGLFACFEVCTRTKTDLQKQKHK